MMEPLGCVDEGKEIRLWGHAFERNMATFTPPLPLFAFQSSWSECLTLPCVPYHYLFPYRWLNGSKVKKPWTRTFEIMSKKTLSSLKVYLSLVFVIVTESHIAKNLCTNHMSHPDKYSTVWMKNYKSIRKRYLLYLFYCVC